jgi:hypothetical protein
MKASRRVWCLKFSLLLRSSVWITHLVLLSLKSPKAMPSLCNCLKTLVDWDRLASVLLGSVRLIQQRPPTSILEWFSQLKQLGTLLPRLQCKACLLNYSSLFKLLRPYRSQKGMENNKQQLACNPIHGVDFNKLSLMVHSNKFKPTHLRLL